MKPQIDLDKAAEAEAFGALAVGPGHKNFEPADPNARFTPGQARVLARMAQTFLEVARENGAEKKPLIVGDISLDLQKSGSEEILSIRTVKAAA